MPGSLNPAVSIGTLPHSVSTKFTEAHGIPMNINRYRDNSSQRTSLATGVRKSWKIAKRLDSLNLGLLRTFFYSANGGAFYFYNPSETNPPFTNNPTGTAGRYLVRFNNDWSQTNELGRISTAIELVEVLPQGSEAIPVVTIGGGGLPSGGGGTGGGGGGTPTLMQFPVRPSIEGGEWLRFTSLAYDVGYGPINYGGELWMYGVASEYDNIGSQTVTGAGMYRSRNGGVTWTKEGGDVWFGGFPNAAYYDPNTAVVTFLIGGDHAPNAEHASLVYFDLSTVAYGVQSATILLQPAAGSTTSTESNHGVRLFKLSNGTFRVVYESVASDGAESSATNAVLSFVDYSGGAWGTRTLIAGADGLNYGTGPQSVTPFSTVQDGDTIHLISAVVNGSTVTSFQHWTIAADGTISTPETVGALDLAYNWTISAGMVSGDSIIIPAARESGFTTDMGVLVGTPKNNPTFTWVQIVGGLFDTIPLNVERPHDMKVIRIGSTEYLGWLQRNPDSGWTSRIYVATSGDDGATWTAPKLLLDVEATPPPNTDADGNYTGIITVDGDTPFTRKITSFSFGPSTGTTPNLAYTSWATYWTNAPLFLP
jgi:hypothetical protein